MLQTTSGYDGLGIRKLGAHYMVQEYSGTPFTIWMVSVGGGGGGFKNKD